MARKRRRVCAARDAAAIVLLGRAPTGPEIFLLHTHPAVLDVAVVRSARRGVGERVAAPQCGCARTPTQQTLTGTEDYREGRAPRASRPAVHRAVAGSPRSASDSGRPADDHGPVHARSDLDIGNRTAGLLASRDDPAAAAQHRAEVHRRRKRSSSRSRCSTPHQSVSHPASTPAWYWPIAMTSGKPALAAKSGSWCNGLKSPPAPAKRTMSVRDTGAVSRGGGSSPGATDRGDRWSTLTRAPARSRSTPPPPRRCRRRTPSRA